MERQFDRCLLPLVLLAACAERVVDPHGDASGADSETAGSASEGGSHEASDGDASGEDASCAQPNDCDPLDCGPKSLECGDGWGIGTCVNGECGPYIGFCAGPLDRPRTCNEICALTNDVCIEGGCRGSTVFGWPSTPEHDPAGYACEEALESVMTTTEYGCGDAIDFTDPALALVRCCCLDGA